MNKQLTDNRKGFQQQEKITRIINALQAGSERLPAA
jgi:hypothetical protein